ncbi:MAG: MBL fold metallo-hydrolase [Gammaproteobacteria bacterium]|nr:MBL fold metallo-hydrolase [Gammaproteobacteria bacterium]
MSPSANLPVVTAFFDEATNTVSYVVADPTSREAAVIDPVLDFDAASGRTATTSMDLVTEHLSANDLTLAWILETHVHADHLSAAQPLRDALGGRIGIGANVTAVQETFKAIFNLRDLQTNGAAFDHLFADGESFTIGSLEARVLATPGHTPACITYIIGDAAFVGDTLFMPDFGTARTDFPGGSAAELYDSIQAIFALPSDTRLFMCHDYKAPGRNEFAWETSVQEQREKNIHITDGVSKADFVALREGRDKQLGMPALILPSIQVNIRAGILPAPEDNDIRYLKIPLDTI